MPRSLPPGRACARMRQMPQRAGRPTCTPAAAARVAQFMRGLCPAPTAPRALAQELQVGDPRLPHVNGAVLRHHARAEARHHGAFWARQHRAHAAAAAHVEEAVHRGARGQVDVGEAWRARREIALGGGPALLCAQSTLARAAMSMQGVCRPVSQAWRPGCEHKDHCPLCRQPAPAAHQALRLSHRLPCLLGLGMCGRYVAWRDWLCAGEGRKGAHLRPCVHLATRAVPAQPAPQQVARVHTGHVALARLGSLPHPQKPVRQHGTPRGNPPELKSGCASTSSTNPSLHVIVTRPTQLLTRARAAGSYHTDGATSNATA